jgi:hypothetical protein
LHGEAAAAFAGAYTTSHHKSTLLIGSMFSFYNAGSGTNQSNHMYKLGPVHQGILERGVKTGSDSYLMLEARVGAFSLVLGHHEAHFDSSDLPFSYILSKDGRSEVIPAVNFQTVGTQRDSRKWKKRDSRKGEKLECISYDLLNPYVIGKILRGIAVLEKLSEKQVEYHSYKGLRIKNVFVKRGIEIYKMALICYLGEKITQASPNPSKGGELLAQELSGKSCVSTSPLSGGLGGAWFDLSGLIIPQTVLEDILIKVETEKISSVDDLNRLFADYHQQYSDYETMFVRKLWQDCFPDKNLQEMLSLYAENLQKLSDAIVCDAEKEFGSASMVGFGIDGDAETQRADFEAVRGSIESNEFVQQFVDNSKKELNSIKDLLQK